MTTVVSDTFADTAGTAITAHTGLTGATWSAHAAYATSDAVISNANRARGNANASGYLASGIPGAVDYEVQASLTNIDASASNYALLWARATTAASETNYAGYFFQNTGGGAGSWNLDKNVAGVNTNLGSVTVTLTASQTYVLNLHCYDAAKNLTVDGVQQITSADNTNTAAGQAGFRISPGSNTVGDHLSNYTAVDTTGAAPAAAFRRSLGEFGTGAGRRQHVGVG